MKNTILKNRNFLLFLFGNNTSVFGDILLMTGFSLFVLAKTESAMQFSMTMAIAFIPRILLSPSAGVWVDRMRKKPMVIYLDFIRGLWLLGLWGISINADLNLPIIYATLAFFAVCDTFFGPSYTTIFQRIISKDQLSEANAISNTVKSIISVLSPVVASFLFIRYGLALILILDGVTFFASALSELFLVFDDAVRKSDRHVLHEIIEGMQMVYRDVRLKSLVINGNLTHLFLFPFIEVGVIYILLMVFKAPEFHYGVVQSSISAGAIFSGALALYFRKRKSVAENINIGIFGMLGAVLIFELLIFKGIRDILFTSEYLPAAFLSLACFAMFMAFNFYGVFFGSFYQSEVSQNMLGRFTSLFIMTISISRLLGMLLYGALFESNQLEWALIILFIGMALKVVVHIPFIKYEKSMQGLEEGASEFGAESSTG